jgi:class 3 adenylate cyclase
VHSASQPVLSSAVEELQIQVGLHSGKIVAGVIGSSKPRFKLFGDTVNTASRMQSTSLPGRVQVSTTTHALLLAEIERSSLISRLSSIQKSSIQYDRVDSTGFGAESYNSPQKRGRGSEFEGAADDKEPDSPVTPLSAQSRGKLASKKLAAWNQQNVRMSTLSSLRFEFEPRTPFKVKGKGIMQTFFIESDDLTPIAPMTFIHDTMNSPSVHDGVRAKDKINQADAERQKRIQQLSAGAGMLGGGLFSEDVGADFDFKPASKWQHTMVEQLRGIGLKEADGADGTDDMLRGAQSRRGSRRSSRVRANVDMTQFDRPTLRTESAEFLSKHQQLMTNHAAPVSSYTQLPALQIIWGLFGPDCSRRVLPLERATAENKMGSAAWALEAHFVTAMQEQWVSYVQQGCCIFILVIIGLITYDTVAGYDTDEYNFNALLMVRAGIVIPLCFLYICCSFFCPDFFHHHVQTMSVLLLLMVGFMLILQVLWQNSPQGNDPNPYILGLFIVYEIESLRIVAFIHRMWIGFVLALAFVFGTVSVIEHISIGESMANFVILLIFWLGQLVPALLTEFADRSEFNHMKMVQERVRRLKAYDKQSESLLLSLLPATVIETLKNSPKQLIADYFGSVTILFTDIVQFTAFSSKLKPSEVVEFLNDMFSFFDDITEEHKAYKVEIIGDAYFLVSGCPLACADHAATTARVGMEFLECLPQLQEVSGYDFGDDALNIRIGIHSGPVMAGVVGMKDPRYHLFGSTVHLAEKMESTGEPGRVHLSNDTYELLESFNRTTQTAERFECSSRGAIEVKGHRGPMETYFLERHVKPQIDMDGSQDAGGLLGQGGDDRDESDSGSNKTNSFSASRRNTGNAAAAVAETLLRTATRAVRAVGFGNRFTSIKMPHAGDAVQRAAAANVQQAAQVARPQEVRQPEGTGSPDSKTATHYFDGNGAASATQSPAKREHWAANLRQPGDEEVVADGPEEKRRRQWEEEQTQRLSRDEWARRGSGNNGLYGSNLEPLEPLPTTLRVSMVEKSGAAVGAATPATQSGAGMVQTKKERRTVSPPVQREGSVEMGQMPVTPSHAEAAALGHSQPRPLGSTSKLAGQAGGVAARPRPSGDPAHQQISGGTPKKSLKIARPPPPKLPPPTGPPC